MPRPRKQAAGLENPSAGAAQPPLGNLDQLLDPALPKTAQVYDVIRKSIVSLDLQPGSAINEKAICEQLGISRTPLREAILRLAQENLVKIIPASGTYVSRIDLQNVFDGNMVRDALEMKVVRLAAIRMTPAFERKLDFNMHQQRTYAEERDYNGFYELDEQFHSMICEFGASAQIWRIVNGAKAQLDRVRRLAFPAANHLDIVLAEHSGIVAGLKLRDPERAAEAMQVHLDRVFDTIRRLISEHSEYFNAESSLELENFLKEQKRS